MLLKRVRGRRDVRQRLDGFFQIVLRAAAILLRESDIWELVEAPLAP